MPRGAFGAQIEDVVTWCGPDRRVRRMRRVDEATEWHGRAVIARDALQRRVRLVHLTARHVEANRLRQPLRGEKTTIN